MVDGYLDIGCVMHYGPWCYGLTSARCEQPAGKPLLQHSAGPWDCDVTRANYHHELLLTGKVIECLVEEHPLLQLFAKWVGHFGGIPQY